MVISGEGGRGWGVGGGGGGGWRGRACEAFRPVMYRYIYTSCPDLGLVSSEVFYYTFFPLTQGFKCSYARAHTHTHMHQNNPPQTKEKIPTDNTYIRNTPYLYWTCHRFLFLVPSLYPPRTHDKKACTPQTTEKIHTDNIYIHNTAQLFWTQHRFLLLVTLSVSVHALLSPPCLAMKSSKAFSFLYLLLPIKTTGKQK